jgi:signal peptidase II
MTLWLRGLAAAAAIVVLDQFSKYLLLRYFDAAACEYRRQALTPFFDLVSACNRGMSFGLFSRTGPGVVGFTLVAALIVLGLVYWLRRVSHPLLAIAIGLVIGGAIGNVIDRLRFGGVVDFLDFHIGSLHYPAFNLADSAISIGVVAMLLDGLLLHRKAH